MLQITLEENVHATLTACISLKKTSTELMGQGDRNNLVYAVYALRSGVLTIGCGTPSSAQERAVFQGK